MLMFNLKKLIVNKKIERFYFAEKQSKDLKIDLKGLQKKIDKLGEKDVVKKSALQADYQKAENIQNTYKKFKLEEEYFKGLVNTIKKNFWRL